MDRKKFQKNIEDFICENCGRFVRGNGFTNHCPDCLFSKHVDINPGDRACSCCGLMRPVSLECKNGNFVVVHECLRCHFRRNNRVLETDNIEELIRKLAFS
ncbi:MAG: RNHCP domain-containing protein [Rickettsiales bacterium]|nr:RNHCP domain-containing protein [Rickettsiales bacterium]